MKARQATELSKQHANYPSATVKIFPNGATRIPYSESYFSQKYISDIFLQIHPENTLAYVFLTDVPSYPSKPGR
jgi:hypothetical protein